MTEFCLDHGKPEAILRRGFEAAAWSKRVRSQLRGNQAGTGIPRIPERGFGGPELIRLNRLTADQIRAYVIADNRLAEKAGWDNSALSIELQHLLTLDLHFDVTITGFKILEIDLLLQESGYEKDSADNVGEELSGPAVSCPGDLWRLGKHRVMCSNALDEQSFQLLLGNSRATAVFVDPPFNVKIEGHACGNGAVHHCQPTLKSGQDVVFLVCPNGQGRNGSNVFVAGTLP